MQYIWYIVVGVIALALGILFGVLLRKGIAESKIKSAEAEAKRIVDDAVKAAEARKKEMIVEAKEDILKAKTEAERENKERRQELIRLENRALSKEEALDRKLENYERRSEALDKKLKDADKAAEAAEALKADQLAKLEEIAGYTVEAAKEELVSRIETDAKREAAVRITQIENRLKDEADTKAKNIISLAIQRLSSDTVSETTVSVVPLPSDEMKGRIIGREGRNIHKIETLTGVDLIIDDTPEAITLSCFDPIRREVARLTLEKLIADGRIHPSRIEETVDKARHEVEAMIKQAGERATFEVGVNGLHPDLIRFLGRLKFRTSYGQNVLNHSIEVAHLCGMIASELGVEIAKKYKESKAVIHAIEAHHGDVEPQTIVAVIVQAADAISAARPGARREDLESYIKRLQRLEEISNSFPGVEKSYAVQAGREIRIMVKPEQVNDDQMVIVARDIVKKIEEELEYPGQIKVNVIRESRAIEYAK